MTADLERLLATIQSATSWEDFVKAYPPTELTPAERELNARCAAAGIFDQRLYDEVLTRGLDGEEHQSFEEFTRSTIVQPVVGSEQIFKVTEPQRAEYLRQWTDDRLKDFSRELVAFYEGTGDDVAALAHLIVAEPERAKERFLELYKEADDRFDLARCDSLLRVVRERSSLRPELTQVLNDREQYYRGRTLFADSYFRTVSFYRRDAITAAFEEFLCDPDAWIFQLYASGGFGKTMYLNWFASRYCAVEIPRNVKALAGRRIPVARLDFDFIHLRAANRWPWLLLLPIARQLDQQVAHPPFRRLIRDLEEFDVMLRRPSVIDRRVPIAEIESKLQTVTANRAAVAPDQFMSGLGSIPGPVIVILDTLEEAVLHHQAALRLLLQQLKDIRGAYNGLKVILSGRYDLREPGRFPDFAPLIPQTRSFQIPPFSIEEARDYLRSKRDLKDYHPVDAIVRKASGNPFKLSLFADLALSRSSLTAEEIENYPRLDFAYLIERVILRIPDEEGEVRWALRYGVIPRQLTLEFMREVMAPHIVDAMRSERPRDRANETLPKPYAAKKPFRSEPGGSSVKSMEIVWSELQKYASSYGWVTSNEGALQFQPEVVTPMRMLLQQQDLFRLLHRDAARYFKSRADTQQNDSSRWAVSMAEAVYHVFQLYGVRASRYWKRSLACKQAQSAGARRTLAEVLISRDFLDDLGEPLPHRRSPKADEPILDAQTLARAYLEVAFAAAQDSLESAAVSSASNIWEDARNHLGRASTLDPRLPFGREAARWSMIEGAVEIGSGFPEKAVSILREALDQDPDPAYQVILHFQLGDALERIGDPDALAAYRAAYRGARDLKLPPIPLHMIERRLGRLVQNAGDLKAAHSYHEKAFRRLMAAPRHPSELATALLEVAEVDRLAGQWNATVPLLGAAERIDFGDRRPVWFAAASVRVRAALDQSEPLQARQLLGTCEKFLHGARSRALNCELRAAVLSALFNYPAAEAEFQRAQMEWRAAGSAVEGSYCLIQQARMAVRSIGDNRLAQTLLDTVARSGGSADSALRASADMLSVEIFNARQELHEARALWRDLLGRAVVRDIVMRYASVRSAGLAQGLSADPADWLALCETLESIRPGRARLVAVQSFRRAEHVLPPENEIRRRLEFLMPPLAQTETAGLAPIAIDFYHAIGAASRARQELEVANEHAFRTGAVYLLRELAVAADRIGANFPWEAALNLWNREFQDTPSLMAITLLEEAERADRTQAADLVRRTELLQSAEHHMKSAAMPASVWTARCRALASRIAKQAGDQVAAATFRQEAALICEELDNRALLQQLLALEPGNGGAPHAVEVPSSYQIELRASGRTVEIRCSAGDGRKMQLSRPVVPPLVLESGGNYSADALRMWASHPYEFAQKLENLLGFDRLDALIDGSATTADLALILPRGPWSALPMEIAAGPTELQRVRFLHRFDPSAVGVRGTIAWAQSALSALLGQPLIPDGILGPVTQQAIEQYQRDLGLARSGHLDATTRRRIQNGLSEKRGRAGLPRVLILQRSRESERFAKESYGAFGLAVADLYAQAGVSAVPIEPDPRALADAIMEFEPEVIHIVGSFRESTDVGEVHLFFDDPGSDTVQGRQLAVSPSVLASILHGPTARPRPTVILETPAPPDRFGTGLQLFLRNVFAADLFARGLTEAVLATGLARELGLFGRTLVTELSQGKCVGQIAQELRHLAKINGDPFAPTALWATDPENLLL
jgi:tetratricopeptide (TPR) repeat protein